MANVLASVLIGNGYDALVVFGYASREMCYNISFYKDCPVVVENLEKLLHEKKTIVPEDEEPKESDGDDDEEEDNDDDTEDYKLYLEYEDLKEEIDLTAPDEPPLPEEWAEKIFEKKKAKKGPLLKIGTAQGLPKKGTGDESPPTADHLGTKETASAHPDSEKREGYQQVLSDDLLSDDDSLSDSPFLDISALSRQMEGLEGYEFALPPEQFSKFRRGLKTEIKRIEKITKEHLRAVTLEAKRIAERPPPDDIRAWRIHSWVLVLPGKREIAEPFYIDPPSGNSYDIDHDEFVGIESVWNHLNYWVKKDIKAEPIDWNLSNTSQWDHVLPAEPITQREEVPYIVQNYTDFDRAMTEKHLDIIPWSGPTQLPPKEYEKRFSRKCKVTFFKRTVLENHNPLSNKDGLMRRITLFRDVNYEKPFFVSEYFLYRKDLMVVRQEDLCKMSTIEYFAHGRGDALRLHSFPFNDDKPGSTRIMVFYVEARKDALKTAIIKDRMTSLYYEGRRDKIYVRKFCFLERFAPFDVVKYNKFRETRVIQEKYEADENEDYIFREFYKRFNSQEKCIITLKFDITGSIVTKNKVLIFPRNYRKDLGPLKFHQENIRQLYMEDEIQTVFEKYKFMIEAVSMEEKITNEYNKLEKHLSEIILGRRKELSEPILVLSKYNRKRNLVAKKEMENQTIDEDTGEQRLQNLSPTYDILVPYLHLICHEEGLDPNHWPLDIAVYIRKLCLDDFRHSAVLRANRIFNTYEKIVEDINAHVQKYSSESFEDFGDVEEWKSELERLKHKAKFNKKELNRLMSISFKKYRRLVRKLTKDPRLQAVREAEFYSDANIDGIKGYKRKKEKMFKLLRLYQPKLWKEMSRQESEEDID